ncbi:TIGR02302 family protein [Shimia sp. SDUM112013]|uniref:TIGR02302 family protein n=1 Tax=Shimia sp. SDUM112013 TaxID=3136160 RepID=UPI0032ED3928
MGTPTTDPDRVLKRLALVLALTRLGMVAESLGRSFWPLWSLAFSVLAAVMLGVHETLGLEVIWTLAVVLGAGALALLVRGIRRFHMPTAQEAFDRLDTTLPGRPLHALRDQSVVGATDAGTQALWQAHQARMAETAGTARPVQPDLRLQRLDPFGLRHIALLALAVSLLFGSAARVASLGELQTSGAGAVAGPSWEGWIEPPAYTGKPALYLADQPEGPLMLPQGSRVLVRLYGEVGALTLSETVSGRTEDVPSAAAPEQDFSVTQSGALSIEGPNGRSWDVAMIPDKAPQVILTGVPEVSGRGEMSLPFSASDDYEVVQGSATISLDLDALPRRYGLKLAPEMTDPLTVALPMPITGDRDSFEEVLIEDFSDHVWAHLPVRIALNVEDAKGLSGQSAVLETALPARRFFDPLAAAVIEMRRDLLWNRDNAGRVAQLMRAVSHRPEEGIFDSETSYLRFRMILRRLENMAPYGLTDVQRDELAEALWDLAMMLEEGDLGDALERMERARDRLAEAMKNGASDEEIARLMQELREATQDYLRELARRNMEDGDPSEGQQQLSDNMMQMNQDDLQRMMDRIQELMEQGRMAEAMQALEEFQRMMENMRVTQGGGGEGEQSPGQQAMEGLAETLRDQQGLSDEAFRELQEQFNPDANTGQSQGNQGYSGGDGRGQAHDGTGQGSGQEGQDGQSGQTPGEGTLADRQQALRQQLENLQGQMPGRGTPEGDAAAEALGDAGEAMDRAEDALRGNDLPGAIDEQAQAMEALREGMRNLGEAMAEQQQGQGQQGNEQARGNSADPLGRSRGSRGPAGTEEGLLQGEDVYREARELLDEIRRRAGEADRPELERNYLKRLLDRF